MADMVSSVSPKGQVTVPVQIRRLLGIKPKDKVAFRVEGKRVELTPARTRLDESYMAIPALKRKRSWKEVEAAVADEQAAHAAEEGRQ